MSERPRAGRRILVTRRPEQASPLIARLNELGATVLAVPAIAIAPPEDLATLDAALARAKDAKEYDWVIFTSGNAVRAVADRLALSDQAPSLPGPLIASVGPATTRAIAERLAGRSVDLQPATDFRAEGLLAAFAEHGWPSDQRCLLPQGDRARDVIAPGLREHGARVDAVVAYRTVVPVGFADALASAQQEEVHLALFASPSAVESFVAAAGARARSLPVAAIGPITAEAARVAGLTVLGVAESSTIEDLVAVAVRCLAAND
jgi:uroporphyrinogen-III synthase